MDNRSSVVTCRVFRISGYDIKQCDILGPVAGGGVQQADWQVTWQVAECVGGATNLAAIGQSVTRPSLLTNQNALGRHAGTSAIAKLRLWLCILLPNEIQAVTSHRVKTSKLLQTNETTQSESLGKCWHLKLFNQRIDKKGEHFKVKVKGEMSPDRAWQGYDGCRKHCPCLLWLQHSDDDGWQRELFCHLSSQPRHHHVGGRWVSLRVRCARWGRAAGRLAPVASLRLSPALAAAARLRVALRPDCLMMRMELRRTSHWHPTKKDKKSRSRFFKGIYPKCRTMRRWW